MYVLLICLFILNVWRNSNYSLFLNLLTAPMLNLHVLVVGVFFRFWSTSLSTQNTVNSLFSTLHGSVTIAIRPTLLHIYINGVHRSFSFLYVFTLLFALALLLCSIESISQTVFSLSALREPAFV